MYKEYITIKNGYIYIHIHTRKREDNGAVNEFTLLPNDKSLTRPHHIVIYKYDKAFSFRRFIWKILPLSLLQDLSSVGCH